jgi:hypothetical protein
MTTENRYSKTSVLSALFKTKKGGYEMDKRNLRLKYAAIKRYGAKIWTVAEGWIEFNTTFVVSCGLCEHLAPFEGDYPFIVELSSGTKFLMYLHDYGIETGQETLSAAGEAANDLAEPDLAYVRRNIGRLNG